MPLERLANQSEAIYSRLLVAAPTRRSADAAVNKLLHTRRTDLLSSA